MRIVSKENCRPNYGPLPPERTTLSRHFSYSGVDFTGPFDIKTYIGRGCRITKGYVLVFVCFATKEIHLEATYDMSTDCFIAAFTRFSAEEAELLMFLVETKPDFLLKWSKILLRLIPSKYWNGNLFPLVPHITGWLISPRSDS
ncbi:uncharacterized protein LOC142234325 [Haematobia irritans]|uniref:uncharacterized protein LOC142234314 n=1 Tax=Haematobia irritans TaxID=7368 RepID=UPI003F50142B